MVSLKCRHRVILLVGETSSSEGSRVVRRTSTKSMLVGRKGKCVFHTYDCV